MALQILDCLRRPTVADKGVHYSTRAVRAFALTAFKVAGAAFEHGFNAFLGIFGFH